MRTYSKLTTCAITVVCLIFTQLDSGMLAQDNGSSPRMPLSDDETSSSSEQVSTNGQSADVPTSASNVSESSPASQTATPQTTRTDSNKKSIKKWILIGAAAAAAITAILLIKKSEPEPQVSIGTPSVGAPE